MFTRAVLLTCCLSLPGLAADSDAGADAPAVELTLAVGQTKQLGLTALQSTCDDPSIVEVGVSADQSSLTVKGVKVGTTLCRFGMVARPGRLYQVRVVAPQKAK